MYAPLIEFGLPRQYRRQCRYINVRPIWFVEQSWILPFRPRPSIPTRSMDGDH
jgi:hypothetical protein